jgi:hypothetical protein
VHKLKIGALAHELTTDDRRKAAAVTNEIRRAKRELADPLELNRQIVEETGPPRATLPEAARAVPSGAEGHPSRASRPRGVMASTWQRGETP